MIHFINVEKREELLTAPMQKAIPRKGDRVTLRDARAWAANTGPDKSHSGIVEDVEFYYSSGNDFRAEVFVLLK